MADVHFVLLCFLLCFCMQYCRADYDFLKLVQQWPRSTCNGPNKCLFFPPTSNFTLHGLWATNKTRTYSADCGTTPYVASKISTLKPRMVNSWPSLLMPNNVFWEHEWIKHGRCSENNFKQFKYFKLALDKKDAVDILQVLNKGGIIPGNTYLWKSVTTAIKNHMHVDPEVRCNNNQRGAIQLHEVVLCMDDKAKQFIDCPQSTNKWVVLCKKGRFGFPP